MTDIPDRDHSAGRRWLAAGLVLLLLLAGFGPAPDGTRLSKPGEAHLALALIDPLGAVLPETQPRVPASPEEIADAALHDGCRVGTPASTEACLHVTRWLSREPKGLARPRAPPAS